jgi:type I restriction enzyme S subunit
MSQTVKPGYKQTEVGVIPEEWEVVTATDACDLVVDCKNRTPPVVADSDYAVVRTPNVRDGRFVLEELRFTDQASYREWTARAVPQFGDIMITREAPLGEVCAVPANRKVCLGQRMMLYRPAPSRTDSSYLLFSLMSLPVRANLLRKIGGSTVGHAKVDDIRFLQLPLPPLPEQRAIATALSDVDALLAALDRLIAKQRDLKQAAMQQLLTGQTRLPGFTGKWEIQTVAELEKRKLVRLSRGKVISKKDIESTPGDFPIYSSSVHNNGLFGRYGDFMFDEELITWSVDGGGHFFHRPKHKFSVTNVCGFMRVDTSLISYRFFAAHLQLLHSRKSFDYQSKAHPSVVRKEYQVHLPPLPEQTAIATVLSDMDLELAALEQRRDKTRALKQGMMQELLTGRTRLV